MEKKYVAKDYYSFNSLNNFIWPQVFVNKTKYSKEFNSKNEAFISIIKFIAFYSIPTCTTALFSILLYPRIVYINKKLLKVKNFWSINLTVLPILLFFNVRVFVLIQTYVGFKLIQLNYNKVLINENKCNNSHFINNEKYYGYYYLKYLNKNL